jgi:hypothetical protein
MRSRLVALSALALCCSCVSVERAPATVSASTAAGATQDSCLQSAVDVLQRCNTEFPAKPGESDAQMRSRRIVLASCIDAAGIVFRHCAGMPPEAPR